MNGNQTWNDGCLDEQTTDKQTERVTRWEVS
jgi:hypothetical protein